MGSFGRGRGGEAIVFSYHRAPVRLHVMLFVFFLRMFDLSKMRWSEITPGSKKAPVNRFGHSLTVSWDEGFWPI